MGNLALIAVSNLKCIGSDHRNLMISKVNNLIGVTYHWRCITGDKVLTISNSNDQRTAESSSNHQVRMVSKQNHQSIGASQLPQSLFYRCYNDAACVITLGFMRFQAIQATRNQVGDHFAVGIRLEIKTFANQSLFQERIILNHTIMNNRHYRLTTMVRMGIFLIRNPVRRPASVSYSDSPGCRFLTELGGKLFNSAHRFGEIPLSLLTDRSDSGAVVTAVF